MLFPYAPSYREPIYILMDKELDIDWFFCGDANRNLKMFNYSLLKHCNLTMREHKILGPIVGYNGIKSLGLQQYDVIICAGVIRSLSEWWLLQKMGKGMKRPKIFLWTHGWYGKETIFTFINVLAIFILCMNYNRANKIIEIISKNTLGIYLIHIPVLRFMEQIINVKMVTSNICVSFLYTGMVLMLALILSVGIKKIPIINGILHF